MEKIVVVRPYGERVRAQIFGLLQQLGIAPQENQIIPKGTPDVECIKTLKALRPECLVIPFHAHRDREGNLLNGLDLLERLHCEASHVMQVPILMPASVEGLAAVRLKLFGAAQGSSFPDEMRERILLIDESQVDVPELVQSVRAHIDKYQGKILG